MKISIVIPTFNTGKYIRKAIDSILAQNYAEKELWVIDGGSSDNTVQILKSYGSDLNWISEPDKGQCDALIKGYAKINGEIFAYLNADDWYAQDVFSAVASIFAARQDVTLVYGDCTQVYPDKNVIARPSSSVTRAKLLGYGNLTFQPSTFYLKSAIDAEFGISFYNYMMEYDLCLKALKHGKALYTSKNMSYFLIRPDQKSRENLRHEILAEVVEISRKHGGSVFSPLYAGFLLSKIVPLKHLFAIKSFLSNMES